MKVEEKEIRIIADYTYNTPYTTIYAEFMCPRNDLSHAIIYHPPIKEIYYPSSERRYLFPTYSRNKATLRNGTPVIIAVFCYYSRKSFNMYVILARVKEGARISHNEFIISNAEEIRHISESECDNARAEMMSSGYTVSWNYEASNIYAWILYRELSRTPQYEQITAMIIEQLKKLPRKELEKIKLVIEQLLKT